VLLTGRAGGDHRSQRAREGVHAQEHHELHLDELATEVLYRDADLLVFPTLTDAVEHRLEYPEAGGLHAEHRQGAGDDPVRLPGIEAHQAVVEGVGHVLQIPLMLRHGRAGASQGILDDLCNAR